MTDRTNLENRTVGNFVLRTTALWSPLYGTALNEAQSMMDIEPIEFRDFINGYYNVDAPYDLTIDQWNHLWDWIEDATVSYWKHTPERRNELMQEMQKYVDYEERDSNNE